MRLLELNDFNRMFIRMSGRFYADTYVECGIVTLFFPEFGNQEDHDRIDFESSGKHAE